MRKQLNRKLEVLGMFIGRVKRSSSYWKEVSDFFDASLPGRGFNVQLSDTVTLQRISAEGVTVFQHKRLAKQKIAEEYRELASEIEWRTQNKEKFLKGSQTKRAVNE